MFIDTNVKEQKFDLVILHNKNILSTILKVYNFLENKILFSFYFMVLFLMNVKKNLIIIIEVRLKIFKSHVICRKIFIDKISRMGWINEQIFEYWVGYRFNYS